MKVRQHREEDALPVEVVLAVLAKNGFYVRQLESGMLELQLGTHVVRYQLEDWVSGQMVVYLARLTSIPIEKFHYREKLH